MMRWWKQRKMRWAVREHRRIHGDASDYLFSVCHQCVLLRRATSFFDRHSATLYAAPTGSLNAAIDYEEDDERIPWLQNVTPVDLVSTQLTREYLAKARDDERTR